MHWPPAPLRASLPRGSPRLQASSCQRGTPESSWPHPTALASSPPLPSDLPPSPGLTGPPAPCSFWPSPQDEGGLQGDQGILHRLPNSQSSSHISVLDPAPGHSGNQGPPAAMPVPGFERTFSDGQALKMWSPGWQYWGGV